MQYLILHIGDPTTPIPGNTKNIITYDPLQDNGEELNFRPRPFSTHPHLRPTVKKERLSFPHEPGNPPPGDLEFDDLLELYGYDEERGLTEIILENGTEIEIAIEDELGATAWKPGKVISIQQGSLDFQASFRSSGIKTSIRHQTRNRAEMEVTWRLPPPLRLQQPYKLFIPTTQGYTPWHHPLRGSHWLRLQPRGAWQYNDHDIERGETYGWRRGLAERGMDVGHSDGGGFSFDSAIEDHMNEEDLGPEASAQDRSDLQSLREDLRHWVRSLIPHAITRQGGNSWSKVPPRSRGISCFHASTMVRMYTTTPGAPQYKRMDKLREKDELWTRRYRRNRLEPSLGQISIVECVMTFACPPGGQAMAEIEGNLLTPDHVVARGNGEWSAAGALARSGAELPHTLAHVVYNIKLQEGGQIELGNKVYAGTLGARFDRTDLGKDPTYLAETSKHLHDLAGYSSGHIHWAFGTASVDQHGMPSLHKRPSPPSKIGTEMLLDREILGAILVSQRVDQNWIDTLSMLRRVHSTWNHVARSICPELIPDTPRTLNQGEKETWLSTFYREQERAQNRIREQREGPQLAFTDVARNVFNNIRTYPANLDILIEAMISLNGSIPPITEEDAHEA
jgi:hypothetical protein